MESFKTLKDSLIPGDQLWIFHKPLLMRSYAHVVIINAADQFIHVCAPNLKLKMKAKAKIKEDDQGKLNDEDFCFVVRPNCPSDRGSDIFRRRAVICKGILFDYDAALSNCETFCNGVHGSWESSVQVCTRLGTASILLQYYPFRDSSYGEESRNH